MDDDALGGAEVKAVLPGDSFERIRVFFDIENFSADVADEVVVFAPEPVVMDFASGSDGDDFSFAFQILQDPINRSQADADALFLRRFKDRARARVVISGFEVGGNEILLAGFPLGLIGNHFH